jgi:hypothetical protein
VPLPKELQGDPPALTTAIFRNAILHNVPSLRHALATNRLEAAHLLDDWTANAVNYALTNPIQEATLPAAVNDSAAILYYDVFQTNQGAGYCGTYAIFFDKVLKLFGYNSFTLDVGDLRDSLTHTTVIVPIRGTGGTWQFFVVDPTYNVTFHDAGTGNDLTYFDLLNALQSSQVSRVAVQNDNLDQRNWLSDGPSSLPGLTFRAISASGYYVYGRPGYGLNTYLDAIAGDLQANGYAPGLTGFLQLLQARIFSVGQSLDPSVAQQFINQVQSLGIPLGLP